jgi:ribonucleoside-diphosphate reductase alpha chain
VIQKFFDQAISANWNYNPEHYPNNEIPMSVMVSDMLYAYKTGHKTAYYQNTYDGKTDKDENLESLLEELMESDEETCDSCAI